MFKQAPHNTQRALALTFWHRMHSINNIEKEESSKRADWVINNWISQMNCFKLHHVSWVEFKLWTIWHCLLYWTLHCLWSLMSWTGPNIGVSAHCVGHVLALPPLGVIVLVVLGTCLSEHFLSLRLLGIVAELAWDTILILTTSMGSLDLSGLRDIPARIPWYCNKLVRNFGNEPELGLVHFWR